MKTDDVTGLGGLIAALGAPAPPREFVSHALDRPRAAAPARLLRYAAFELPVGRLFVAFDQAVVLTQVGGHSLDFEGRIVELGYDGRQEAAPAALRAAVNALAEGATRFEYPVELDRLARFQRDVLTATRAIPRGEVRTYHSIAATIGSPAAVRAVGTALARNPIPILVPCHRVVRADGVLGEYSGGGTEVKARILRWEGLDVRTRRSRLVVAGAPAEAGV